MAGIPLLAINISIVSIAMCAAAAAGQVSGPPVQLEDLLELCPARETEGAGGPNQQD